MCVCVCACFLFVLANSGRILLLSGSRALHNLACLDRYVCYAALGCRLGEIDACLGGMGLWHQADKIVPWLLIAFDSRILGLREGRCFMYICMCVCVCVCVCMCETRTLCRPVTQAACGPVGSTRTKGTPTQR